MFILKMPRVRIGDLVEVLVDAYAGRFGFRADEIGVETIGIRAGEKSDEALMTADEAERARDAGDMWIVPRVRDTGAMPAEQSISPPPLLDRKAIRELLDSAGWLAPETLPGPA